MENFIKSNRKKGKLRRNRVSLLYEEEIGVFKQKGKVIPDYDQYHKFKKRISLKD